MIAGKRTPEEERAFKRACGAVLFAVGRPMVQQRKPDGGTYWTVPTTETCPEPTCIQGMAYDVERGLHPCPVCGNEVCDVCGDTGMVTPNVPSDDERFGKADYCPRNCRAARALRQQYTAKLYAGARLPAGYEDCTLDSFEAMTGRAGTWKGKMLAYHAIKDFINHPQHAVDYAEIVMAAKGVEAGEEVFSDIRNSLVLHGPHGVGKTGMVAAVVNALIPAGEIVRYIRTQDFIKAVQDRYGDDWRSHPPNDDFGDMESGNVIDTVRKAPLLILDEFDMPDAARENKQAIVENVIRHRMGHKLPTLITTNLDFDALEERWGVTTVSVLGQCAHFIPMGGVPLRATPQAIKGVL